MDVQTPSPRRHSITRWLLIVAILVAFVLLGTSFLFAETTKFHWWGPFSFRPFWVPVPRWALVVYILLYIGCGALLLTPLIRFTLQRLKNKDTSRARPPETIICFCVSFLLFLSNTFMQDSPLNAFNPRGQTHLSSIAMVSPHEGWAVGNFWSYTDDRVTDTYAVIWHYSAGKWTQVAQLTDAYLWGVAALPNGEAWAVGSDEMILHEQGGSWTLVHRNSDLSSEELTDIVMISADEGWAVGSALRSHSSIWHYSHGTWTQLSQLAQELWDIAPLPDGEIWAVGTEGTILHEQGGTWRQVASPTRQELVKITMVSPMEGWAIGDSGTVLHCHNGAWSLFPASLPLNSIAMLSANEGWAAGGEGSIWYYTQGKWEEMSSPTNQTLEGIAMVPGNSSEGWIVGTSPVSDGPAALQPTILHLQNGAWNMYRQ